jgi:hypothetical protein
MRRFALMAISVLITSTIAEAEGLPSRETLAEMGLTDLRPLSDEEAASVRGMGFDPGSQLAGFASYEQSKAAFHERVGEFRSRLQSHSYRGAADFTASQLDYHRQVQSFHDAVGQFRHKIH